MCDSTSSQFQTFPPDGPMHYSFFTVLLWLQMALCGDRTLFYIFFALLQVLGNAFIIMIILWASISAGGYGWNNTAMFNWHPTLMLIGMIYLYGNGKFIYS